MKFVVAQKGAREHYAAVRALQQRGMLAALVTDWYAPSSGSVENGSEGGDRLNGQPFFHRIGASVLKRLGKKGQSALAARCPGLPDELVHSFPLRTLYWKWKFRTAARQGTVYDGFLEIDSGFAKAVAAINLPPHDIFFGFSYASLEILQAEKRRGAWIVLDQIDPGPAHYRVIAREMDEHSGLSGPSEPFPEAYFNRVREEWKLADLIVVNSQWSRDAIISEGADAKKIEVLPLAYEAKGAMPGMDGELRGISQSADQTGKSGIKVLWMGQVAPAKGIYYLVEAARLLEKEPVEFVVAGSMHVRSEYIATAPSNIRWLGMVPRSETAKLYQQCDVFVLSTLSDGFAITQLEAMSNGLPVIATPNCGRVVEEGKTGFIVPPRDAQALAAAIKRFINDRSLARSMAASCRQTVKDYSIEAYGRRLVEMIERFKGRPA